MSKPARPAVPGLFRGGDRRGIVERRVDLAGVLLLGSLIAWVAGGAAALGVGASSTLSATGLAATAYLVGRALAGDATWVGPVVAAATGLVVLTTPGALSADPLAPPLNYANANGALYAQAAAAAGMWAGAARSLVQRIAVAAFVGALVLVTTTTGSTAASVIAAGIFLAVVLTRDQRPGPRLTTTVTTAAATAAATVFAGSVVLASVYGGPAGLTDPPTLVRALSERRMDLWHDAVTAASSSALGLGAGMYSRIAPTPTADPDTRAAHSAVLEVAADHGWVAGGLVLALGLWVLLRIRMARGRLALVGCLAWAGFVMQTGVDYVADFPLVLGSAALIAGLSTPKSTVGPRRVRELERT